MARELNRWIRETADRFPDAIPLGTVHAGDDDPGAIVEEACGRWGLAGLKLHIQVQRFLPDDPRMWPVYARLVELDRALVIHVGTGPHRNEFTGLAGLVRVLERLPGLRAAICHMGAFETRLALELLDRFPELRLDTTMAMTHASTPYTGIDPAVVRDEDLVRHADRILFGSDFPHEVFDAAKCRHEIDELLKRDDLTNEDKEAALGGNALKFYRPAQ